MTTNSDKTQVSSDDAKETKQSPVAPKTKITVDKAKTPVAPEPKTVAPPVTQPSPPVEEPPVVEIPPAVTPPPAAKPVPEVPSKAKNKEVVFRSIREEFTCCIVAPKTAEIGGIVVTREPAVTIRFKKHKLTTSDEKIIKFLRKIIDGGGTDSTEIFEMPEIDELLHGNIPERLERMSLSELRQVAEERSVSFMPTDAEVDLRYKLLQKLLGMDLK